MDNFLPSSTAANNPASAQRQRKSTSSPKTVGTHPLHAAIDQRQRSVELMDIAANETSMPSRISVGKEAPSALDFIQRFRNAKGGEIDWSGVNYDTYVRVREMDFDKVEKARPSKPFVNGSPLEYARYMSKFDSTTNRPTFGSKDKLDELALWFGGDAHHIISTHITSDTADHDTAFALAKSELDTLFKGSKDTFSAIVRSIVSGKQLAQYDQDGHLHLYADLKKAEAVAVSIGATDEFERRDVVQQIINARLNHMADRFLLKDEQRLRDTGKQLDFDDLLQEIGSWMWVLRARSSGNVNDPSKKASVAAVTSSASNAPRNNAKGTYATKLANSPPKQQSNVTCNVCGGRHSTQECNTLREMSVEKRVEALQQRHLCFHCMVSGHRASTCTHRPTCNICSKKHATLLHDRKFQDKPQQSTLSANALTFRPMPETTSAATTSGQAAPASAASTANAVL